MGECVPRQIGEARGGRRSGFMPRFSGVSFSESQHSKRRVKNRCEPARWPTTECPEVWDAISDYSLLTTRCSLLVLF